MLKMEEATRIVLFDGVCNFCNGSVNFIIARDPRGEFSFAAIQSETGGRLMREAGMDPAECDSVILIEDGNAYVRSDAALRIARRLGAPWSAAYALTVLPRALRDLVYRLVAENRYRFFGRRDECMLPTPEVRGRFLD
jgi:predicted DCC family thiol-disulfide oxidoreductase YuxK